MPIWMLAYIFALNVFSYKLSYLDSGIFSLSGEMLLNPQTSEQFSDPESYVPNNI